MLFIKTKMHQIRPHWGAYSVSQTPYLDQRGPNS